jgi:hypothetical protein
MNVVRLSSVAAVVSLALAPWGAAPARAQPGEAGSSLEADFQRLAGSWRKDTAGLHLLIGIGGGSVRIAISGRTPAGGFARTGIGRLTEAREDAGGRFLELEPFTAQTSGLPPKLYYRFTQDALILTVNEGLLRGEHRLVRDSGAFRLFGPWLRFGLLVVAALAILVLFLLWGRGRARRAT